MKDSGFLQYFATSHFGMIAAGTQGVTGTTLGQRLPQSSRSRYQYHRLLSRSGLLMGSAVVSPRRRPRTRSDVAEKAASSGSVTLRVRPLALARVALLKTSVFAHRQSMSRKCRSALCRNWGLAIRDHLMRSGRATLSYLSTGSHSGSKYLKEIPLPVPPLGAQEQIVGCWRSFGCLEHRRSWNDVQTSMADSMLMSP